MEQRRFRDAMGLFPTGVTLVTTRAADGADHAITANSVTSVSLDPLLLLVCVEHASRLHGAVLESGLWAVSVLGQDGEAVSRRLARRGHDTDGALAGVPHSRGPHTGALVLDTALSTVECRTVAAHPGGDHTVLIGAVLAVATPRPEAAPLVWHRGRYTALADRRAEPGDRFPGPGDRLPGPGERLAGPGERLAGPGELRAGPGELRAGPVGLRTDLTG